MDIRELMQDPEEAFRAMLDGLQAKMWTAIPCSVNSVDFDKQTASMQPLIKSMVRNSDGTTSSVELPLLNDVPLHFPSGGGVHMTFPVAAGDEALVIFSSRPTDSWQQSGGAQNQIDARMHDLSDGFALVGFKSTVNALSSVSSSSTQIRSTDGKQVIDIHPSNGLTLTSGGVSLALSSDGLAITGGTVTHNGKDIGDTHIHGGVTAGGDDTGVPV